MSDHPAKTRADNYPHGQPIFSRTLLKQTNAWLKRRGKERKRAEGTKPPRKPRHGGGGMSPIPNPGSDRAREMGCTCPVMDNGHGSPEICRIRGFIVVDGCPVHPPSETRTSPSTPDTDVEDHPPVS